MQINQFIKIFICIQRIFKQTSITLFAIESIIYFAIVFANLFQQSQIPSSSFILKISDCLIYLKQLFAILFKIRESSILICRFQASKFFTLKSSKITLRGKKFPQQLLVQRENLKQSFIFQNQYNQHSFELRKSLLPFFSKTYSQYIIKSKTVKKQMSSYSQPYPHYQMQWPLKNLEFVYMMPTMHPNTTSSESADHEDRNLQSTINKLEERIRQLEQENKNLKNRLKPKRRYSKRKTDLPKIYQCSVEDCNKHYSSRIALRLHLKKKHSKNQ